MLSAEELMEMAAAAFLQGRTWCEVYEFKYNLQTILDTRVFFVFFFIPLAKSSVSILYFNCFQEAGTHM